ncbi:MAG: UDP-3-O-[3-hydroxymyristoyl] N-acetylglucosamine deacetylase [Candidatus Binataceae bacterium]|nr:UDP-3-O-[3-hydroxymyristoyl] N-acetylglucosamine deacetylase [Candidatus Binataceae bacterium]
MNETVLVVDDEERIRSSLRGILSDEGFRVLETGDAPSVPGIIARENPALVLLDVWMPEMDGIELLRQIKADRPRTRVIMISGHANIQNAVAATKLGAEDFIEKPFSVSGLLTAIERVMGGAADLHDPPEAPAAATIANGAAAKAMLAAQPQRTIARSIVMAGQGLHSGLKTGVILHPAPVDSGIVFSSLADQSAIAARLENVTDTGYNTTLTSGGHSVRTVEHLMSALHGLGITNLMVKTEDEIPVLDGSALEFCRQLIEAGIEEQAAVVEPIRIGRPIVVGNQAESIRIEAAAKLIIDYTLEYPAPIGRQQVHFELDSPETYMREIAPARTFGFVREFRKLSEMGLARGGRLDNVILLDDEKIVNTTLRFADEFARHKVLDLVGDLYLLGRPIAGHVTAARTGHADNLALLRAIRDAL